MWDIFLYLFMAFIGGLAGKKTGRTYPWMDKSQNIFLIILISSLGIKIGIDKEVMRNFGKLGLYGFVFTVLVMAGSVLAVSLTRKIFGIDRYGKRKKGSNENILHAPEETKSICSSKSCCDTREENHLLKKREDSLKEQKNADSEISVLSISILITVSLVAGVIAGVIFNKPWIDEFVGIFSKLCLCGLLFVVGIGFGIQGNFLNRLKEAGPLALIIPCGAILGSLAGGALCSFFMPVSLNESFAIASGFGWYSLAPNIMMEKGYVMAGTIAFIHNILRELFGIMAMSVVAKNIGYAESVSLPGSSCMDVCLPIIEKVAGRDAILYSFFSGGIMALLTPVLVTFFIS